MTQIYFVLLYSVSNDRHMHCSMETPPDPKLQPFFGWVANAKDLGQMELEHDQVYAYAAEVSGHTLIESWL